MAKEKVKKVLIQISGGAVVYVKKPSDTKVVIQDYDIENNGLPEERDDCKKDRYGDWYQEMVFNAKRGKR